MDLKKLLPILLFSVLITLFSCIDIDAIDFLSPIKDDSGFVKLAVDHIVDGDTFYGYVNGEYKKVRIVGIDTPETHAGNKPIGEYGEDAKRFLENFVSKYEIYLKIVGNDEYRRTLAYVFGKNSENGYIFYEESVLMEGYARPLIYLNNDDRELTPNNDDRELTPRIVQAYYYAFENRKGIFSKWNSAKVLSSKAQITSLLEGKIVFLEGTVKDIRKNYHRDGGYNYYIDCDWFEISIRDGEYEYFFKDYNLYSIKGKKVRFYGELWFDDSKPEILLRSPNEIVVLN